VNRALIWKEFREQGLIVAALVILGSGVLVAAGLLFPSVADSFGEVRQSLGPKTLAVVLLMVASGIVVGGTLFAGEREQGTFPYLEQLPVPRWRIWLGKVLAGLVLVLIASGALFAVAAGAGVVGPTSRLPFWALMTISLALAAFSWGTLGSAYAKTSLGACGVGLLSTLPLTFILYPLCAIGVQVFDRISTGVWGSNATVHHTEYALSGTLFGLIVIPLAISAWIFTAPDRNRFARDVRAAKGLSVDPGRSIRLPRFSLGVGRGFRAALWVVARQNLVLTIVLASITVVSGLSLLQPSVPALFIWPMTTLMLGTIVGVTGWSDEQNAGSFRFWAERRMPLGQLWLAKVVYGLALVALLVVLLALPSLAAARIVERGPIVPLAFHSRLFLDRGFPVAEYLWLWPIYGFAFGHLAGMLFRKAAVGTAVGLMTGGSIVAFWLPSLLSGGIHWYQLWIPPLLALATARALVWSWALDQLGQRRALLRLGFGGSAIAVAMTLGIGYRIVEIPEDDNTEADIAFRAQIPPFETNDAGRELRRGGILFAEVKQKQRDAVGGEPLWPNGPSQHASGIPERMRASHFYQLEDVLALGWPSHRPDADAWLDACMANGWAELLLSASAMPIGTVEDPTELNIGSPLKHLDNLQSCEMLLLARGLQLQAAGHPDAFVDSVAACLSLVRNLRNKSFAVCGLVSAVVEKRTHLGIQRWLEKLGDRPDLLREVVALIRAHDATCPKVGIDGNLPNQVTTRNAVNAPTQFVKLHFQQRPLRSRETSEDAEAIDNETDLVAFAWAVPWEKERLRRLVGLGNNRPIDARDRRFYRGLPGFEDYFRNSASADDMARQVPEREREELAARRASQLLLALRLHRAERGVLPATLDALVPKYLPSVPLDPYDDQPFRYRISKGETIEMESLPPPIPADPEMFAAVLGGPAYGTNGRMSEYFDYAAADGNRRGAILGGMGYYPVSFGSASGMPPGLTPPPVLRLLDLPAGRGILWSIGPDKIDGGGKRLAVMSAWIPTASGDWIFPVPEPAEAKR